MARPPQHAIEMFMSITGASEAAAVRKLEEHSGDLNGAVHALFNEGVRINPFQAYGPIPRNDFMNIDGRIYHEPFRPSLPLFLTSRDLNPFSLVEPNFGRSLFDAAGFSGHVPWVSHPRNAREIPIEVKDENSHPSSSGLGFVIEDVTGKVPGHGSEIHGTVIINDEDGIIPTQSSIGSGESNPTNSSALVTRQDSVDPDNMTYEELQSLGEAIGDQTRGLSDELISYLRTSKYKSGFFSRKNKQEECVICMSTYKNRDKLITLPCQHYFHSKCITRWLKIDKTCPVCKEEVFGS